MSIYAIGDLHLSFNDCKPMNIFGPVWENHEEKIRKNWLTTVTNNDLVILPGDFSWSMHLKDTYKDFEFLNSLPGKKLLTKGNHDYWWETVSKMRKFIKENNFDNIDFLINDSYLFENKIIAGTRGWIYSNTEHSEKINKRELIRLELSIQSGINKYQQNENYNKNASNEIICVLHYPPITKQMIENKQKSEYIELMKKYDIKKCIFGHLHGHAHKEAIEGNVDGINLKLVSADYLNFKPYQIY